MKPICFIGARGGSKGVIRKNIRKLGNKPLIAHTIESAIKSDLFQNVIVSTDDKEIAKIAKKYGAEIPFMRPKKLATDNASFDRVMLHGVKELKKQGYDFDIIVNRDCTVPFIQENDMKSAINLLKRKKCDLICAVYKQHHNPYFNMMELNSKHHLKFSKKNNSISGRQNAPVVYQLNGLFVLDVKSLLKYKKFYMPKILPFEISPESGFMIDTEFEFQIADCIAQKIIKI
jgi:CMP-N,N'-diacetyllegionaminic acid synthase